MIHEFRNRMVFVRPVLIASTLLSAAACAGVNSARSDGGVPYPEDLPPEELVNVYEEGVHQAPVLIGGMRALHREIEYPKEAREAGIQGRVVVQFIVDEEGTVRNAFVLREIGEGRLDEEVLRVIRKARFEPGRLEDGTPVKVLLTMPIYFKLNTMVRY